MVSVDRKSIVQGFRHVLHGSSRKDAPFSAIEKKIWGKIWYSFSIDFAKKPVLLKSKNSNYINYIENQFLATFQYSTF